MTLSKCKPSVELYALVVLLQAATLDDQDHKLLTKQKSNSSLSCYTVWKLFLFPVNVQGSCKINILHQLVYICQQQSAFENRYFKIWPLLPAEEHIFKIGTILRKKIRSLIWTWSMAYHLVVGSPQPIVPKRLQAILGSHWVLWWSSIRMSKASLKTSDVHTGPSVHGQDSMTCLSYLTSIEVQVSPCLTNLRRPHVSHFSLLPRAQAYWTFTI